MMEWIRNCKWTISADLVNLIPLTLLIIIYLTSPPFEDNFFIRKEMKYLFICLVVSYCCWYFYFIYRKVSVSWEKMSAVSYGFFHAGQFAAMMISTFWVNRQCDRIIAGNRYELRRVMPPVYKDHTRDSEGTLDTEYAVSREEPYLNIRRSAYKAVDSNTDDNTDLQLEDVLVDDQLINLFASHLIKDFSEECLLSLIEFEQFRARASLELGIEMDTVQPMTFASTAPRSDIVYGTDNAESTPNCCLKACADSPARRPLKECAYRLYEKYIEIGSEFQINISGEMRMRLDALMDDYDKWMEMDISDQKLCEMFDDAIDEMTVLMSASLQRFECDLKSRSRSKNSLIESN